MGRHELAGKPAPKTMLADISRLIADYYSRSPEPGVANQQVSFGTSGHRGTSRDGTFTDRHIAAVTQALVEFREREGIDGPLFVAKDTHALSIPAERTAVEVLAANGVAAQIQQNDGVTPTPVLSHAILTYNKGRSKGLADGIIITPSHNPPEDGGFKYNPPNGGPANETITRQIQVRANELLANQLREVRRTPFSQALHGGVIREVDFRQKYIADLGNVINMEAIRNSGVSLGVDPLGGASVDYWGPIAEQYGLKLTVVNKAIDPQFGFMTLDHDGKIRMDCSSPDAMAGLVLLKDQFDLSFANDPDADRHGIVTRSMGLMNPNHYLAVAIHYLFQNRPGWPAAAAIGKTLVSSAMIDRVAKGLGRTLLEVPVGFKWFVDGLYDGSLGFGGEESAGASFLRRDGTVWSTDKDGLILNLLAAEILAVTGKDPGQHYQDLTAQFGAPCYTRIDQAATPAEKTILKALSPQQVSATSLAGDTITAKLTAAPGNSASIGGLKVESENGWFAARPSGTENIYKIYAESFRDQAHLNQIVDEARAIVSSALKTAG